MTAPQMRVTVVGLRDMKKALAQVAPDLKKEMEKNIRLAIQPVRERAQSLVPNRPLSGWRSGGSGEWASRLGWDASKVRSGIAIRQGGGRVRTAGVLTAWRLTNANAAGAVYELAGRKSGGSSPQGRTFISQLTRQAAPSRLIWRAWDDLGGDDIVTPKVVEAIENAEREFQARAQAAKDTG